MTKDEAKFILKIFTTADGGCQFCASDLMLQFLEKYPEYKDLAREIFEKEFEEDFDKFLFENKMIKL